MDAAHRATDKELERIEKKLTEIYKQASKELGEKADKYFERFKVLDQQKRALVKAGKMTEADYKKWRHGKLMTGEHWKEMQKQAAQRLTEADRIAIEYTNGRLPYVYALNYNGVAEGLETRLNGYSFELVDEATVRNLAESDKTLLPYKVVDGKKAERWHTARVNAEVTQGILQGESIPKIAKRLKTNVGMTAKGSAVRNARTSVTSAENKGRIDMLHDARKKGVIVDKIWIAAHDSRTREAHLDLDGQQVPEDEMFKSILGEIEYPGDPSAAPANTYNCRCSLGYKVVGFERKTDDNSDIFNKRGEKIEFDIDDLAPQKQRYVREKIARLSNKYETGLQHVTHEKRKNRDDGGNVDISGRYMTLYSPDIVEHEFFHTLDMSKRLNKAYKGEIETNESFWREAKKLFSEYRKESGKNYNARISEYSETNVDEFMAEAFAAYYGGKPHAAFGVWEKSPYVKRAIKIIDKYFKK